MQESAHCRIASERNAVVKCLNRWDAAVERLVQAGKQAGDDQILYGKFKRSFMICPEVSGQVGKIRRSFPGSKVHSYKWMHKAAKARVETLRLEQQGAERFEASTPDAAFPLTPGIEKTP